MTRGGSIDITADNGIEWHRDEQVVIAQGNARAVRAGVTVTADRLIARYRPRQGAAPQADSSNSGLGGANEIYRLEAQGNVVISTETDRATGTQATYDMDQAVLVMTGSNLTLTSKQNTLTARDSLEYWSARRMAVARGDAVARDTQENRVIRADVLVGYFKPDTATPAPAARTPATGGRPGENTKLDRVEAFGNVEVRTATEGLRGDRGVYSPDQAIARVAGNVRITRGQDQLNGALAETNLNTGVSRLLSAPGSRVQGVIIREENETTPRPGTR